jgi:hypothetical protein
MDLGSKQSGWAPASPAQARAARVMRSCSRCWPPVLIVPNAAAELGADAIHATRSRDSRTMNRPRRTATLPAVAALERAASGLCSMAAGCGLIPAEGLPQQLDVLIEHDRVVHPAPVHPLADQRSRRTAARRPLARTAPPPHERVWLFLIFFRCLQRPRVEAVNARWGTAGAESRSFASANFYLQFAEEIRGRAGGSRGWLGSAGRTSHGGASEAASSMASSTVGAMMSCSLLEHEGGLAVERGYLNCPRREESLELVMVPW